MQGYNDVNGYDFLPNINYTLFSGQQQLASSQVLNSHHPAGVLHVPQDENRPPAGPPATPQGYSYPNHVPRSPRRLRNYSYPTPTTVPRRIAAALPAHTGQHQFQPVPIMAPLVVPENADAHADRNARYMPLEGREANHRDGYGEEGWDDDFEVCNSSGWFVGTLTWLE